VGEDLQHKFGEKGNDVTFRPELMQTPRYFKWSNVDLDVMTKYCQFLNPVKNDNYRKNAKLQ
jgi:hypothetical protein